MLKQTVEFVTGKRIHESDVRFEIDPRGGENIAEARLQEVCQMRRNQAVRPSFRRYRDGLDAGNDGPATTTRPSRRRPVGESCGTSRAAAGSPRATISAIAAIRSRSNDDFRHVTPQKCTQMTRANHRAISVARRKATGTIDESEHQMTP